LASSSSNEKSVRTLEPKAAADVLMQKLTNVTNKPITVADASVASGLALRDADAGLTWLTKEYRGHLRVTEDGDLVHLFPTGFTKPWETKETFAKIASTVGQALMGAGRFIVRAWLLIVMIGYALLFLAAIIGLTVARQGSSSDRDESPGLSIFGALLRMIADALFWMFHPFSPLSYGYYGGYSGYTDEPAYARRPQHQEEGEKIPFYEKVNRFVFGPPVPKEDPQVARSRVLREIRAQKGRIALADVMRVTGLPRDKADPLMAELMLDHEGDVDVSEGGGIVYRFEALRRTAEEDQSRQINPVGNLGVRPRAAWERLPTLPPLTGNTAGSNILVALLNFFNLAASGWVLSQGLTISNLFLLFDKDRPPVLPDAGTPIALGVIPFVFSLVLFTLPLVRSLLRLREVKKNNEEHARLAVMKEILTHSAKKEPVTDEALRTAVRVATGEEPSSKDITKRVVELGGDVDVGPEGEVRYRFADLEADTEAAEAERSEANDEKEARLGKVVFASDQ
jgi:hypothetical protein